MALTVQQYLDSLLRSITSYYSTTYSSDTDLYQILQMYSNEFYSGSLAADTIKNNAFIVTCETSKLYDNFGTMFTLSRNFEQSYDEDRYVAGSGSHTAYTAPIYDTISGTSYVYPPASASIDITNNVAVPGYRKQLDFLIEASVNGSTVQGINRTAHAFTLVNPDVLDLAETPAWRLKTLERPLIRVSSNIWQLDDVQQLQPSRWQGAHLTMHSGSIDTNKIAAGYLVLVHDNTNITVGEIHDKNLLYDFVRVML